ncbi:hypothetical protein LCGC14_2957550 [marine sediment metagenome]|uniref:Uncharacterized protein n=1 Tax=marine sediment metagenome TaxID=412755 RepID=A0A0F8Y0K4_9ZZZZ
MKSNTLSIVLTLFVIGLYLVPNFASALQIDLNKDKFKKTDTIIFNMKLEKNIKVTNVTLFIDDNASNQAGTNWLNFDLRSFEKQLDINSFSDTSMTLHFGGLPGTTTVTILDPGDISSAKGFVEVDKQFVTTNIMKIVNQSHDSIVADVPRELVDDVKEPVKLLLERPLVVNGEEFTIPVDTEIGEVWGELEAA